MRKASDEDEVDEMSYQERKMENGLESKLFAATTLFFYELKTIYFRSPVRRSKIPTIKSNT